jgi:hypothetical protein
MNNVVTIKQKLSPLDRQALLESIWQWTRNINSTEFQIVLFIYMRTIFYGKKSEFILLRHFLNGVPNTKIGPISVKRRQLQQTLQKLLRCGLIERKPQNSSYRYNINFEWDGDLRVKPEFSAGEERTRARQGMQCVASGDAVGCTSYKQENKEQKNSKHKNEESGDKPPHFSPEENLKKKDKASSGSNIRELEALWIDEIKKEFPECQVLNWTSKEFGQVRNFYTAFSENNDASKFKEFMIFSIQQWPKVCQIRLGWAKDVSPPEYPQIGFWYGYKKAFLIAYSDIKFHERQIGATEREREINKLRRMGYTLEQAEKEIEHKAKTRGSLQKEINRANQAETRAALASRENQRLQRCLKQKLVEKDQIISEHEKSKKKDLNPGSKTKPKQKVKRDKDGYVLFKG